MHSEFSSEPPEAGSARVFQISVSDGGVPKLAAPAAEVTPLGVSGDRQRNLEVHGGPERAVCLYSLECILALQAEGHPIYPGAAGENLTLSGMDWPAVVPGVQLRVGNEVFLEITRYTSPCSNIAPAFLGRDSNRISQKKYPGWSRVYARVLQPGKLRVGDIIRVVSVNRDS